MHYKYLDKILIIIIKSRLKSLTHDASLQQEKVREGLRYALISEFALKY